MAVTFCTKDESGAHQPLEPLIEIDLHLPDGRRLMKYGRSKAADSQASDQGCDVRIGEHRFTGDLHEYTITGAAEDVSAEVRLDRTTESWRPETGHILFGADGKDFLAWVFSVPTGKVTATYRIGSEVHQSTGMGYHDHNWLSQPYLQMGHLIDHWYWGRGQVGRYSFVTAYITAAENYGLATVPLYMLARDGKVIADDGAKMTFSKRGSQVDEHTDKPVPDAICFDYRDGDTRNVLTYARQKTLVSQRNLDLATGLRKVLAEIVRYPGGYLRFSGTVSLDRNGGQDLVEHLQQNGSFEQCYFGRAIHSGQ